MKYRKKPVVVEALQYDGFHTGQLNVFCGSKIVEPVGSSPFIRTLEGDMTISKGDYVIKGVNGEFYPCKPDIFDKTYEPVAEKTGMSFGLAIEAAKKGCKIRRAGWNGKNQHVELASCIAYKSPDGSLVNAEHEAIGNKALAFCGTSGVQMGWLASQADMLADDWEIV